MSVLSAYMYAYHTRAWCPQRPGEGFRFPGIGVTDACELLCGCWETNPGTLQEQKVLLTTISASCPLKGTFKRETKHDDACTKHDDACTKHDDACTKHDDACTKHDDARTRHDDACAKHDDACAKHDVAHIKYNDAWTHNSSA